MIRFGHLLGTHPSSSDNYFDTVLTVAKASEDVGLDALFYSDHFQFQRPGRWVRLAQLIASALRRGLPYPSLLQKMDEWTRRLAQLYDEDPSLTLPMLECFTTLAAIAAATQRIRLGALVAGVPYRNPALLARMNTTLDVISHGRCIVGLGAGWYEEEFRAYGWPFPSVKERLDGLEDAIRIMKVMLTRRRATYRGQHYRVEAALNHPLPIQQPCPPLLIGGSGEQRTLRLVAQYADYANIFGDPLTVARKLKVLDAHCTAVHRPPSAIIRSNFVSILIAANARELAHKRRQYKPWLGHAIVGTPEQVIAGLQAFLDVGIQYIIFNLPDAHTLEPIHLLAETVIPALAKRG